MLIALFAFLRALGRFSFLLAYGAVFAVIAYGLILPANPTASWSDAFNHSKPLIYSLQVATVATCFSLFIGGMIAVGASMAGRGLLRTAIITIAVIAVITMPSIYGYAWLLGGTSGIGFMETFDLWVRASDGFARLVWAGLIIAMWLWPIPALLLTAAISSNGRQYIDLAMMDARPFRAWFAGLRPILVAPILAAVAAVFVLSVTEATIAPLFIPQVRLWPTEMMAQAGLAFGEVDPSIAANAIGYLFRQSWLMLAILVLFGLFALLALRRFVAEWRIDENETQNANTTRARYSWFFLVLAAALILLPLTVFTILLLNDMRYSVTEAFSTVWQTARDPLWTSFVVALVAVVCTFGMSLVFSDAPGPQKNPFAMIGLVVSMMLAMLPTSFIGTAVNQAFSAGFWGNPSRWNLFDDTPTAWTCAMIVRFAFIPIVAAWLVGRSSPDELIQQARVDGADELTAWIHGRLPLIWRTGLVGALLVGVLTFSEASASGLTAPTRWGGGSLAAYVDRQMHYERHGQTLALTFMMYVPALIGGIAVALLASRKKRIRQSSK